MDLPLRKVFLSLLFLCIFPVISHAAETHVIVGQGSQYPTIKAAVDAIKPHKNRNYVLTLLPGFYEVCDQHLPGFVHLRGSGHDTTTLQCRKPDSNILVVNKKRDVHITRLRFAGSAASAVRVQFSNNIRIESNRFNGRLAAAIVLKKNQRVSLTNNRFQIETPQGKALASRSSHFTAVNNLFALGYNAVEVIKGTPILQGNVFDGVISAKGGSIMLNNTRSAELKDNTIENSSHHGVMLEYIDDRNRIVNNVINSNRGHGIHLLHSKARLRSNEVTSNGSSPGCRRCVDIHSIGSQADLSTNVFDTSNQSLQLGMHAR